MQKRRLVKADSEVTVMAVNRKFQAKMTIPNMPGQHCALIALHLGNVTRRNEVMFPRQGLSNDVLYQANDTYGNNVVTTVVALTTRASQSEYALSAPE